MEQVKATMSAQEAADYLGISYWLILELVKRHDIKHARVGLGRGKVRFRKETLDDWLTRKEESSISVVEKGNLRRIKA